MFVLPILFACSGADPGECERVTVWPDADGDGYAAETAESLCPDEVPEGWLTQGTEIDCDDSSSAVHPGGLEVAEDGIDQDCDGDDLMVTQASEVWVDPSDADCQDLVPGTMDAPNCDLSVGAELTEEGGTVYVASGEQTWWPLPAGRNYLGGRDPAAGWEADPAEPSVITQRFEMPATLLFGTDTADTYVEGFRLVGTDTFSWPDQSALQAFGVFWNSTGKLTLTDVTIEARGERGYGVSAALLAASGTVELRGVTMDGGSAATCMGISAQNATVDAEDVVITGCDGVSDADLVSLYAANVTLQDVSIAGGAGAGSTVGIYAQASSIYLSGVELLADGVHEVKGIYLWKASAEVKESLVVAAGDTDEDSSAGVHLQNGSSLIAANSAFDCLGTAGSAVEVDGSNVTIVNSQLLGGTSSVLSSQGSSIELVANNFWSPSLVHLVDGPDTVDSAEDLNACAWTACTGADGNTAGDPAYLDDGTYALEEGSPSIDAGVDPTPFGLIVDRDIVGNPSPSDGDGDGFPNWDIGPFEK